MLTRACKSTLWFWAAQVGEVARKHRGEFFGELALLRNADRNASIIAATPCRVLHLGCENSHIKFSLP